MKMFRVLLLLAGLAASVQAQEFRDESQKKFYVSYRNLLDISDFLGVNRLVGRDQRAGEGVLEILGERFGYSGEQEVVDEMLPLAEALDKKTGGTVYSKRVAYLQTLDGAAFQARNEAHELLRKANAAYDEGRQNKDQALYRRALSLLDEALPKLIAVKDLEWASFCRFRLGHSHELLSEYYEAVVAYDVAMDEWIASGRPRNDQNYAYMADKRRELIDKGYDPDKDAPTAEQLGGGAKKNTLTSFAEGSEWVEHSTTYKKMKKFLDYPSSSPYCSESILLWRQFGYNVGISARALASPNKCRPFDHDIQVLREGSKGFFDVDGDGKGDLELKVIDQKPSNNEIVKGKGRGAEKYALWLTTGGQNLTWLGQQVNYQELGFYRIGCYRETKIAGQKLLVIDDNCSGSIGDQLEKNDGVLDGYPAYMDLDSMVLGKEKKARPFSEILRVGDQWIRIKPSDSQGKRFKSRALELESGFVQLDWVGPNAPDSLVISEVRELRGAYFDVSGKDAVEVPVGRYQIAVGKIESGKKLAVSQAWIFKGKSVGFEVKAGETTTLAMGAPYTFDFETDDRGREFAVIGKSILVYDRMKALIGRIAPNVLFPEVAVRTSTGTRLGKGDEMKMITTMQFNKDQNLAWYPQDFVISKGSSVDCEAQLTLKKDKLLGGPFASDWH